MSPKVILTDVAAVQAELERLTQFCEAQRDLMTKVASLLGGDSLVPAAQVASLFEAGAAWSASLADRLDDAHEGAFGQLTILLGGQA